MLPMKRPRLPAAQALPGYHLALTSIDGQQLNLDLSRDLRAYPGLQPFWSPVLSKVQPWAMMAGASSGLNWTSNRRRHALSGCRTKRFGQ